ncbi:hypothetical protein [Flavobacterium caseinilyticum]|uniref:Uncharacterized protein n=1 Tax=Flavobacterium caseinilyticum TaxID=2541732 RepID=A0A4R5AUT3_9FLAO|nr:hypothetical protein [Flavobacterium caseinilyticum]TDD77118.1 hypothetical protein E0F89_05835 [Flavobacterium caseinilyticum]
MAYDIYGNDLRRGYCEVHPHVHQEYPCDICCREIEQSNRQNEYNKQMQKDYYKSIDPSFDMETTRIVIDLLVVRIPKTDLNSGLLDIDFNGQYLIQIKKEDDSDLWKVTNAMNGYGHNCFEEFKKSEVSFLSN